MSFKKSHYEYRRSKEDYLKYPSYIHPIYKIPLQEPYKPSNKKTEELDETRPARPEAVKPDNMEG